MKRQILIYSGFNRAQFPVVGYKNGIHRTLTDEWIKDRYDIWFNYTWKSLLNQEYEDWAYCLCCHPESKRAVDYYFGLIKDSRFNIIYDESEEEKAFMENFCDCGEIVNVRIDSDDMYHKKAILELNQALDDTEYEWFLWRRGYCFQYQDRGRRMKIYNPRISGPFFAKRYTDDEWVKNGMVAIKVFHKDVINKDYYLMPEGRVCVGITQSNSTTFFKNKCFKGPVSNPKKKEILKGFGIEW